MSKALLFVILVLPAFAAAQTYVTGAFENNAYGSPHSVPSSGNLTGLTAGEMVIAYGQGTNGAHITSVTNTTAGGIPVQTWTPCGITGLYCYYAILTASGYMKVTFRLSSAAQNYDLGVLVFSGVNAIGTTGVYSATTTSLTATTSGSVVAPSSCIVAINENTNNTGSGNAFTVGTIAGSAVGGSHSGFAYASEEYQCDTSYSGTITATASQAVSNASVFGVMELYYFLTPTAAAPTYNYPMAAFLSTLDLTISSLTGGATICYTTDGSTPTAAKAGTCDSGAGGESSLVNGGTVTLSSSVTTVNALATESGYINSAVVSGGPYVFLTLTQQATDNFSAYYNLNYDPASGWQSQATNADGVPGSSARLIYGRRVNVAGCRGEWLYVGSPPESGTGYYWLRNWSRRGGRGDTS